MTIEPKVDYAFEKGDEVIYENKVYTISDRFVSGGVAYYSIADGAVDFIPEAQLRKVPHRVHQRIKNLQNVPPEQVDKIITTLDEFNSSKTNPTEKIEYKPLKNHEGVVHLINLLVPSNVVDAISDQLQSLGVSLREYSIGF